MQLPLSASPGLEQRAKSERISAMALFPGLPQRSGLDTMVCSLMAKSAYDELAPPGVGMIGSMMEFYVHKHPRKGELRSHC
jgi:hypothetical protein